MLGCRRGFSKRIQDACGVEGARGIVVNWCGSHQLNLVVGEFLTLLDEFVDFRSILGREISFTRTHESVSKQLGKCPTYATTRWSSIYDACNYLMQNYSSLQRLQDEKGRIKSSPLWWLCLFMVADLTRPINVCFQMLQHKSVTTAEQYDALRDLNATLLLRFQDGESDTSPEFSYAKMEQQLCGASPFSRRLFDSLSVETQHKLVDVFLRAVKVLADGSVTIQIEVGDDNSTKRPVGPLEVIACDDGTFSDLLDLYSERLIEHYDASITSVIWNERKALREESQKHSEMYRLMRAVTRDRLDAAWSKVDSDGQFNRLRSFAVGIGSISPGTHSVEGDFSHLKRIKSEHRGRLSNFALEGQLQAMQYFDLIKIAASSN